MTTPRRLIWSVFASNMTQTWDERKSVLVRCDNDAVRPESAHGSVNVLRKIRVFVDCCPMLCIAGIRRVPCRSTGAAQDPSDSSHNFHAPASSPSMRRSSKCQAPAVESRRGLDETRCPLNERTDVGSIDPLETIRTRGRRRPVRTKRYAVMCGPRAGARPREAR